MHLPCPFCKLISLEVMQLQEKHFELYECNVINSFEISVVWADYVKIVVCQCGGQFARY